MSIPERSTAEIHAELDRLAAENRTWVASWIAKDICERHSAGLAGNDHADFWRHHGYVECRDQVRRCINSRAGDRRDQSTEQKTLFGWEHLQAYYVVKRRGEEIGVPLHALTASEIRAKAARYRSMADACTAHAFELERYLREREASA